MVEAKTAQRPERNIWFEVELELKIHAVTELQTETFLHVFYQGNTCAVDHPMIVEYSQHVTLALH